MCQVSFHACTTIASCKSNLAGELHVTSNTRTSDMTSKREGVHVCLLTAPDDEGLLWLLCSSTLARIWHMQGFSAEDADRTLHRHRCHAVGFQRSPEVRNRARRPGPCSASEGLKRTVSRISALRLPADPAEQADAGPASGRCACLCAPA